MATKNQMALGPHGMAYHLAELLHATVWDKDIIFYHQLMLITRIALTVRAIIEDEVMVKAADKDLIEEYIEQCKGLLGSYMPMMEENDGAGLRAISQLELIEIEAELLAIIKRNKLVTQQLLASARVGRPGADGPAAAAEEAG